MRPVAVLGATGAVGQRFLERLDGHPWFEATHLVASPGNAGRRYTDATGWTLDAPMPEAVADQTLCTVEELPGPDEVPVIFSALPGGRAGDVERMLARKGHAVFTNARDLRMAPDVPLLIPEVNPDHLNLVGDQEGPGFVVANGNCSGIILTLALAPLHRAFGLQEVDVTTLQGLSGAGYPGVSALDIVDNVLPRIPGEEEKLETEPQKTLGASGGAPAPFSIHATATRVPVRDGHLESVHARLATDAGLDAVAKALRDFCGTETVRELPSAPVRPIVVTDDPDRPQPRRDRSDGDGMTVTVGRLRPDGSHVRFLVLGHNTIRGAAGQSILNAEYAVRQGLC